MTEKDKKKFLDLETVVSDDINQVDLEFDRIRLMNTIYNKIRTHQYDTELTENSDRTEVMGK